MAPKSPASTLRAYALKLPGAWEDHPWGESVAKVGKKVFVFFGKPKGIVLSLSVKLPESGFEALELPFTEPTGYGLGKGGWVTASFADGDDVPVEILTGWIEESYRVIAPRKMVAELDGKGRPEKVTRVVRPVAPVRRARSRGRPNEARPKAPLKG